jgi:hypothetical protein
MSHAAEAGLSARARLMREIRLYAFISTYLWLCFGAVYFYRAALLAEHGLGGWHFGLAAAKALVLGKFIMLLHGVRLGDRGRRHPLAREVLLKSLLFLAALVAMTLVEEVILGLIHHESVAHSLAAFMAGRAPEIAASCLILWMVLLPYLAFRGLSEVLGPDRLREVLFGPR